MHSLLPALRTPRSTFVALAILWLLAGPVTNRCNAQRDTFQMSESQFNSWVFNNNGGSIQTADQARTHIKARLDTQIILLDQAGPLDDIQKAKLELAAECDIARFFDGVDAAKRKITMGNIPQEKLQEYWEICQPLSQQFIKGLTGRGSLFEKTVRTTLNAEQLARYDELDRTRKVLRYEGDVRGAIANLESAIPLTQEQRTKLIELVLKETQPSDIEAYPYYRTFLVLYKMSRIPEEKLKPLFVDDVEWEILSKVMARAKQYEPTFKSMGIIEDEPQAEAAEEAASD